RSIRSDKGPMPASSEGWFGSLSIDLPCLFRQHDRDAVTDRVGEFCRTRDQFLLCRIEFQRALGQRADQDFQKLWIDGAFKAFGRGIHTRYSPTCGRAVAYQARVAIRSISSMTAFVLAGGGGG